jgi:uncharacterized protein YycO
MPRFIKFLLWIIFASGLIYLGLMVSGFFVYTKIHGETIGAFEKPQSHEPQNGDIIFQTSKSSQSKAIQLATQSEYSHMGIIYEYDGQFFVYEAIQPVKLTPLNDWVKRGENGHYVIKRLQNSDEILTPQVLLKMKTIGDRFKGKNYDIYFDWSDDKIYCSELVWKIYKEATGIEIGQLQTLSEFDLSNDVVQQKMKERYGDHIPLDEKVISPVAMFNSDKLITIEEK